MQIHEDVLREIEQIDLALEKNMRHWLKDAQSDDYYGCVDEVPFFPLFIYLKMNTLEQLEYLARIRGYLNEDSSVSEEFTASDISFYQDNKYLYHKLDVEIIDCDFKILENKIIDTPLYTVIADLIMAFDIDMVGGPSLDDIKEDRYGHLSYIDFRDIDNEEFEDEDDYDDAVDEKKSDLKHALYEIQNEGYIDLWCMTDLQAPDDYEHTAADKSKKLPPPCYVPETLIELFLRTKAFYDKGISGKSKVTESKQLFLDRLFDYKVDEQGKRIKVGESGVQRYLQGYHKYMMILFRKLSDPIHDIPYESILNIAKATRKGIERIEVLMSINEATRKKNAITSKAAIQKALKIGNGRWISYMQYYGDDFFTEEELIKLRELITPK